MSWSESSRLIHPERYSVFLVPISLWVYELVGKDPIPLYDDWLWTFRPAKACSVYWIFCCWKNVSFGATVRIIGLAKLALDKLKWIPQYWDEWIYKIIIYTTNKNGLQYNSDEMKQTIITPYQYQFRCKWNSLSQFHHCHI